MSTTMLWSSRLSGSQKFPPQVLDPEALDQVRRGDDLVVVLDKRAFVELAQRDPDFVLRDLVLLDQDRLDVGLTTTRLGHRRAQLLSRDPLLRHEVVELGLGLGLTLGQLLALAQLGLVVEGDPE